MANKIAVNSRQLQARVFARTEKGVLLLICGNLRIILPRFVGPIRKTFFEASKGWK
jgi:hypothetical protein